MAGYVSTLVVAQANGSTFASSSAENSLLPAHAKITLPAGYMAYVGKRFRIQASGVLTTVTTPGTLTLKIKMNAIAAATSQAYTLNASAQTNVPWLLTLYLDVRTIGASTSATIYPQGVFSTQGLIAGVAATSGSTAENVWNNSAPPVVGTGFDTTIANTVDFTSTFSTAVANSITLHTYSLEDMTTTP